MYPINGNSLTSREHCMDFLRVIAILLMFIYHVSMIFVAESGWHIKNAEQSRLLLEVNEWLASFRMPLLFFVSGYISYILLQKTSTTGFVRQRFMRLIVPTALWTFILVAPQIYLERKLQGSDINYIEFYGTFLDFEWWPAGNFHWLHLWFIPYLFVYNLLSIPLLYLLKKLPAFDNYLRSSLSTLMGITLYSVLTIIPYTFLEFHYDPTYDLIHDYARHAFFIFFVVGGLLLSRHPEALIAVGEHRANFLRFAFLATIAINAVEWNDLEPWERHDNWISMPETYLFAAFKNITTWAWLFAFVGYAKRYITKGSGFLTYSNIAVYPFYILHQTVIVIIGFYVVQTPDNIALKYVFLLLVCFFITVATYHLFIRPYPFVRHSFGGK